MCECSLSVYHSFYPKCISTRESNLANVHYTYTGYERTTALDVSNLHTQKDLRSS